MSDYKEGNPKNKAATTRLDLTLFPMTATIYGALGMTEGHLKYGGYNFREKGASFSTYLAALMRHMKKLYNGEWRDAKSMVPHLGNLLADAAIIVDAYEAGVLIDDRPPACDVSGLLDEMEEIVAHLQGLYPDGPDRSTELPDPYAQLAETQKMREGLPEDYTATIGPDVVELTKAEVQSGLDRIRFAELLIRQLPEDHEGRNTWLLNYGAGKLEEVPAALEPGKDVIEPGDMVLVHRKVETDRLSWNPRLDTYIGCERVVQEVYMDGTVKLRSCPWLVPMASLVKV